MTELEHRVDDRIHAWQIAVERLVKTESSILVFGQRHTQSVVLKVVRDHGDEWCAGDVLSAFEGNGVVRILEYFDGAVLLERLKPGHSLVGMSVHGGDEQATAILADVMQRLSPRASTSSAPTIQEWGGAFERHEASAARQIPQPLLEQAQHVYTQLCASQSKPRLLHGDLHHYNVLLDAERGWLAIDPKGVVGEPEYEAGAALRNPYQWPELFTTPATIASRVRRFSRELHLDGGRIMAWGFAQAVLAAVWAVEDGFTIGPDNAWIALANRIRPMLKGVVDV